MCDIFGSLIAEIYKDVKGLLSHPALTISPEEFQEQNEKLLDQVGKLSARRQDIEKAFPKGLRPKECQNWIDNAKAMEGEVKVFEDRCEKEEKRSCKWVHRYPRYMIAQDMIKTTCKVNDSFREGEKWKDASHSAGQTVLKTLPRRRIRPLDSEWMPSVHKDAEEKLIAFLRDEKVTRIGVWGITGSGKSVIMDNLRKNEDAFSLFETVILVAFSAEWGVKGMLDDIMGQLKLNAEGISDMAEKARMISNVLQTKKCLILIDNVEEKVELDQLLGIQDKQEKRSRSRSKVVFASRSRGVCLSMKADDLVHVDRLSPNDAWIMFKGLVGDVISRFPRIEEEARLVARECDGLPLLIDMVARNLRDITDHIYWVTQLKQLRGWESFLQSMDDEAIQTIEFCYDSLDDSSKKCFLYCALYPEECKIYVDHLLECWITEGFIRDKSSFRDARDMGYSILHDLISGSFLARTESQKYVKMSKLLRKMALHISSQNNQVLVNPSHRSRSQHSNQIQDQWGKARRISLIDSQLKQLPETPDCDKLLTLFLQRNNNLVEIPKKFFRSMSSLRVLDLYGTGIQSLPSSLAMLVSLRALYLNSCFDLIEIPSGIKRLKGLEVLDIRKTKLNLHQIRELIWLKCLRISFSSLIRENHRRGRVSDFWSLEEFSVFIDSSQQWINNVADAIEEVASLENLTSLQFCFPNLQYLQQFVSKRPVWKKKNGNSHFTFHFSVGLHDSAHSPLLDSVDYPIRNSLNLFNTEITDDVFGTDEVLFPEVLKETDVFGLIEQKNVKSLSRFGMNNMEKMLVCLIEGCQDIEVIIHSDGRREAVLRCLKDLFIKNLRNLKSIWEGHVPEGSLSQLTTIVISKCPMLNRVFSHALIQQLHDLKHLKVEDCHEIEEIMEGSEGVGFGTDALPSLKNLELIDLPKLKSILDDSLKWNWPSLQKIIIYKCDKLKRLPFSDERAAKLRRIEGQKSWWEALEWKDEAYKHTLQSHFHPHHL